MGGKDEREPDRHLIGRGGVAYRYALVIPEPGAVGEVLRVLGDVAIPLSYFLLLPGQAPGTYRAYLGLGSDDVLDLPYRLTAVGAQVRRGEPMRPPRV